MITDLQGASRDGGRAREANIVSREHHRTCAGVRERTRAGDQVTEVVAARAVDDQGRAIDDRSPEGLIGETIIVGAQRARGDAGANLQGTGADGNRTRVDIGAGKDHRARTLLGVTGIALVRIGETTRHRQSNGGIDREVAVGAVSINVESRNRGIGGDDNIAGEIEGAEHGVARIGAHDRPAIQGE